MTLYKSKTLQTNHAFFTRLGGVSKVPFDELNVAYYVGDSKAAVQKNLAIIASKLGVSQKQLVFMNQIHSNKVVVVEEDFFAIPTCDALVTKQKDQALMVLTADCAPILFHDKGAGVIAAAHAGREGVFRNIVAEVIKQMQHVGATSISVAVGPRICKECYEVSQKEIDEAKALGYKFAIYGTKNLDLDAILQKQFQECGIEEVEFLEQCTKCQNREFFSYRAQNETGRQASVIIL